VTTTLTGDTPAEHQLTWTVDEDARAALEEEIFGKRVLITDRDEWPITDVVGAYRSQSDAEFAFRQLKDTRTSSRSARCTTGRTTASVSTRSPACSRCRSRTCCAVWPGGRGWTTRCTRCLICSPASRRRLIYTSTGGRPKERRVLTETTPAQDQLAEIFGLARWAPRPRA
jgi:hypothetical protein